MKTQEELKREFNKVLYRIERDFIDTLKECGVKFYPGTEVSVGDGNVILTLDTNDSSQKYVSELRLVVDTVKWTSSKLIDQMYELKVNTGTAGEFSPKKSEGGTCKAYNLGVIAEHYDLIEAAICRASLNYKAVVKEYSRELESIKISLTDES